MYSKYACAPTMLTYLPFSERQLDILGTLLEIKQSGLFNFEKVTIVVVFVLFSVFFTYLLQS